MFGFSFFVTTGLSGGYNSLLYNCNNKNASAIWVLITGSEPMFDTLKHRFLTKHCFSTIPTTTPGDMICIQKRDKLINKSIFVVTLFIFTEWTCNANLKEAPGDFASPHWPNDYDSMDSCSWRLSAPEGYRVKLYFTSFELEEHPLGHCSESFDHVKILDGGTVSAPKIGNNGWCSMVVSVSKIQQHILQGLVSTKR